MAAAVEEQSLLQVPPDQILQLTVVMKQHGHIKTVLDWLANSNLQVTNQQAKSIHVQGSVAKIQAAFKTQLCYTDDSKQFFHPSRAPQFNSDDIHLVLGLDNRPAATNKSTSRCPYATVQ